MAPVRLQVRRVPRLDGPEAVATVYMDDGTRREYRDIDEILALRDALAAHPELASFEPVTPVAAWPGQSWRLPVTYLPAGTGQDGSVEPDGSDPGAPQDPWSRRARHQARVEAVWSAALREAARLFPTFEDTDLEEVAAALCRAEARPEHPEVPGATAPTQRPAWWPTSWNEGPAYDRKGRRQASNGAAWSGAARAASCRCGIPGDTWRELAAAYLAAGEPYRAQEIAAFALAHLADLVAANLDEQRLALSELWTRAKLARTVQEAAKWLETARRYAEFEASPAPTP